MLTPKEVELHVKRIVDSIDRPDQVWQTVLWVERIKLLESRDDWAKYILRTARIKWPEYQFIERNLNS